ncbi:YALI0C02233p [Yarrowia lipolytica CLIB122]|jgi:hypothetical protein|uniref:YALI0C02233p n=2 Tax=Yarrowia lipolytica TaxID=4952 RepID=Q6CDB0_YARLI|nr:YALI0C02233p [Yarrowia lipolytica CLIB122]AOW02224.1 hypothetical protein YALI1_C03036g [Yarrowia lipolytica]KAB8283562.1 hypothetical protein BKA91DRAFT_111324 [Yarrowia lipolytica]KAE8172049.1 hypothetical protein BKA90DRAFT_137944 [Yarrowia lipolytica]KAJ8052969.1 hypothetical protein LXG23DRAFT_54558 [Yarrowia lipolytica]QNP96386.1 Hypothetical protein YALI2_C00039g [Yarrowia lipolytica]|eukprot:XP_501352.1 YALI0C02233p [Yarrowia lipolytica CLIB122]
MNNMSNISNLPTPDSCSVEVTQTSTRSFFEEMDCHVTKKAMLDFSPESTFILTPESECNYTYDSKAAADGDSGARDSSRDLQATELTARDLISSLPTSLPPISVSMLTRLLTVLRLPVTCRLLSSTILDSLSRDFYRHWIRSIPMDAAIHPELVVIATLSVAMKFAEDEFYSPKLFVDCLNCELQSVLDPSYVFPTVKEMVDLELRILKDLDYNVAQLMGELVN